MISCGVEEVNRSRAMVPLESRKRLSAIIFLLIISALSGLYLFFAWQRYEYRAVSDSIILAQSLGATLHPEYIAMLTGRQEEQNEPEYLHLKDNLLQIVKSTESIRFAYLVALRDGEIVYLMDSEQADSPEYTPPGQVYQEAGNEILAPFRSGRTVKVGPVTDRKGTWISILVPILDPETHETLVAFGIEYPASEWYTSIWTRMVPDLMVLSILPLSAVLIRIWDLMTQHKSFFPCKPGSHQERTENEIASRYSESALLSYLPSMAYRCCYERERTMQYISEGCQVLTGYTPENLTANCVISYSDLIDPDCRDLIWYEWKKVLEQKRHFQYEYEIKTKNGERKWVLELGKGIFDDKGNIEALEGIVVDITEQKKREAQITYLSERDFLTGLYNRRFFEKEKARLNHQSFRPMSVAICDINGLKVINETLGYAEGDQLISNLARLIRSCCRSEYIVSRTGGDEFTVLMPHTDNDQAGQLVKKIHSAIEAYNQSEKLYEVSLSVGYSTSKTEGQGIDETVKAAEAHLNHRKLLNQKSSHNAVLSSIIAALHARNHETEEHGHRLTRLTKTIGERMGLEQKVLDDLELLSMLHDIGKIGVNDQILNKPVQLASHEREQMKRHSEIGYQIAMSISGLEYIAEYILHHHECWDGSGYPSGLKGEQIPLVARILAVADAYDAMTEDRVYRRALLWDIALEEIERCSGTQFDPDIVLLFTRLIRAQKMSASLQTPQQDE